MDTSSTTQWYLSNDIYMDTHWQDCYGKDNSRKFYWNLGGKKNQIGSVSVDDKKWQERSRRWLPCGTNWLKRWSWRTNLISWSRILGTYSTWMQNEWHYCWWTYKDVWITYFCWNNWKVTRVEKPHAKTVAWSFDMEGHARNALSDTANWQTKSGAMIQSFKSLLGWSSNQTGRTWISRRIITSLLTNYLEMLVLGTNWTTWHSVVGQQACQISHKMDSSMWQTISKADFSHSSHKQFPTILSCV